jgi:hypothetical protein
LGRERRRAKNRLWPSAKTLRVRADVAMIEMLGDRAYWNGHTESTGTRSQRLAVLAARLRVIEKRQARLVVPEGETT